MAERGLEQADIGGFVDAGDGLGVGRLADLSTRTARLRYFRMPSPHPYEEREVRRSEVRRAALRPHTRIYSHDGLRWRIGRIDSEHPDGDGRYVIAFPNSQGAILAPESFDVRWSQRVDNPFEVLAALGGDSPSVYEPRIDLISAWHLQRSAATGVEGLLLGSVELHDHQLTVVRSVTENSRRRFLLADEVGLGKTIEACALVWQHLSRNPDGRVLVLAPDHLRQQWANEMLDRFHVRNFTEASVRFEAHDDPASWREAVADVLVVDEAHHLTRAGPHPVATLEAVSDLALAASEVLLLSATPVRSNEVAFLDLLSLLDPDNYRPDDIGAFSERVDMRDRLALIHQALTPDLDAFDTSLFTDQLTGLFPADQLMWELAEAAANCTDRDRPHQIARLREHLSETYRLHHRLLRTRRTPDVSAEFAVRGRRRGRPFTIEIDDETDDVRFGMLEEFRQQLTELMEAGEIDASEAARSFRTLAEACGTLPTALLQEDRNTTDASVSRWLKGQGDLWRRELEAYAPVLLERVVDACTSITLYKNRGKAVVISAYTAVSHAVAQALRDRAGEHRVATHLESQSRHQNIREVERWRTNETCRLLVCDASAEEGINLQAAHLVIHLDLPWESTRIEQRIGRADRFDRQFLPPVESLVFSYGDQPFALAWFAFVADAFGVFDQSVSSLQYVLADIENEVLRRVVPEGASVLDDAIEPSGSRLAEEARRIAAHDSLDAVGTEHPVLNLQLLETDKSVLLPSALKDWLSGVGAKVQHPRRDTLRIAPDPRLQVPFDLEVAMAPWIGNEIALSRAAAVDHGLPILRANHGLLDAIIQHLLGDERGVAFAFLRPVAGHWPPTVVCRTDFLVSVGPNELLVETAAEMGLSGWLDARLDSLVPPSAETAFVFDRQQEVTHAGVTSPYDVSRGDRNLTSRPEVFDVLAKQLDWDAICEQARSAAMEILVRRPCVASVPLEAAAVLLGDLETRVAQLDARRYTGLEHTEDRVNSLRGLAAAVPRRLEIATEILGCGAIFLADPNRAGIRHA